MLLPFDFAPDEFGREVAALPDDAWQPHFNTDYYEGDWSGVPLRSSGGAVALFSDPNAKNPWTDTEWLERCPHLQAALASFKCPLLSVRLLRLGPGARIREHRDYQIGFDVGEIRFHIPVQTGDEVDFVLAEQRIAMSPGDCWYVDVTQPHHVTNHGASPRVHLVIDCVVNDWLRDTLATAMVTAFERFAKRVQREPALEEALWATDDLVSFAARAVELGRERGLPFEDAQVASTMHEARLRWFNSRNG